MKHLLNFIAIIAIAGCTIQRKTSGFDKIEPISNQDDTTFFSTMCEAERKEWLSVNTKELALYYFPQFYRDVTPIIWQDTVFYSGAGRPRFVIIIPVENQTGRSTYSYSVNGKILNKDIFSVRVAFWGDSGEVDHIEGANGSGYCFTCQKLELERLKEKRPPNNE